jgi:HSP20 family protein
MATQQQQEQQTETPERGQSAGQGGQSSEQGLERKQGSSQPPRRVGRGTDPFSLVRRLSQDMDRLFGDFLGSNLFRPGELLGWSRDEDFWPDIEIHQEGSKLVIEADVPGLKKDDVAVEVRGNELVLSGERRNEVERREGGYYRSERSYGRFYRTIPLPEGAKPETASATFENGVLRIELEAPGEEERGQSRRIEVREGSPH